MTICFPGTEKSTISLTYGFSVGIFAIEWCMWIQWYFQCLTNTYWEKCILSFGTHTLPNTQVKQLFYKVIVPFVQVSCSFISNSTQNYV